MTFRRRRRLLGFALVLVCAATALTSAAAAPPPVAPLRVTVTPTRAEVRMGEKVHLKVDVTNVGDSRTAPLVVHVNVVSLNPEPYVDPEDWARDRSRTIGPLTPGATARAQWALTAVNGGEFAAYAVVLPAAPAARPADPISASVSMRMRVTSVRRFNSGGVLPVVIAVPAFLGLAWAGRRVFPRRAA